MICELQTLCIMHFATHGLHTACCTPLRRTEEDGLLMTMPQERSMCYVRSVLAMTLRCIHTE